MSEVGRCLTCQRVDRGGGAAIREAMQASVNHLEQFMEKLTTQRDGIVLCWRRSGDLHDIGMKNLVEIF